MEAKYNPETTDSTGDIYPLIEFVCSMREKGNSLTEAESVTQTVSFRKLCTIETYDELLQYVEEMYVNGFILGDEFVMKPSEDQNQKLIDSTFLALYGDQKIGEACGFYEHWQNGSFEILTSFGVKIIIK